MKKSHLFLLLGTILTILYVAPIMAQDEASTEELPAEEAKELQEITDDQLSGEEKPNLPAVEGAEGDQKPAAKKVVPQE